MRDDNVLTAYAEITHNGELESDAFEAACHAADIALDRSIARITALAVVMALIFGAFVAMTVYMRP